MLNNAILCSLTILFCFSAFQAENIFEKQGVWLEDKLGWFYKPVIGCLYCMSPWWGIVYSLIFFDYDVKQTIQFIFAVGGINVLIYFIGTFLDGK